MSNSCNGWSVLERWCACRGRALLPWRRAVDELRSLVSGVRAPDPDQNALRDSVRASPFPRPVGSRTLAAASQELREAALGGATLTCPCCGQNVKVYKRKLNSQIARWMVWLAKHSGAESKWVHVSNYDLRGGDYAKAKYWGLVDKMPNDNPAKRTSGMWRITRRGLDFVYDRLRVPSHAYTYNGELLEYSDKRISIRDALGDHFHYAELMSAW